MKNVNVLIFRMLAFFLYAICTTFAQLIKKHPKKPLFPGCFVAFKTIPFGINLMQRYNSFSTAQTFITLLASVR